MVCRKGVGDMLLRQIKYFVDIIEHNNFTLAAEENGISQSAISQQMAALEAELGVKLLLREGRKFKLTDAGKYFCEKGKVLLENADALVAETRRIGSDDELKLNIGYLASYQGEELQNAILEFSRIYPEVVVTIFNGSHEQLYRALRDGRASIAMSDQRRAFSDEYENYLLAQAPAYADVAPTSPLAERAFLTVDELSSTPCILVAEGGARLLCRHAGHREGLPLCGEPRRSAPDGDERQGVSPCGRSRPRLSASAYPQRTQTQRRQSHRAHLLRLLAEEADELLHRRVRLAPAQTICKVMRTPRLTSGAFLLISTAYR